MNLHQINEEIEKTINEIRALERVLFKVDLKFSQKLKEQKIKMWKKVKFLKTIKKVCIINKEYF